MFAPRPMKPNHDMFVCQTKTLLSLRRAQVPKSHHILKPHPEMPRGRGVGILVAAVSGLAAALCLASMSAMMTNRAVLVAKSARSLSTTAAQHDLQSYFHDQAVIASGRHPVRRHQKGKIVIERDDENSYAIKSGAPPHPKSLSGHAASAQLSKWFGQPHVGPGGGKLQVARVGFETSKQSAAELKNYFTKMGRGIKNGLERKVKKGKQLAAIGAGAEDHNADEVTKAMGIDAAGDYFQQPVAPAQNHIDEANQAGIEQTKDGYTNVPTISAPTPPA